MSKSSSSRSSDPITALMLSLDMGMTKEDRRNYSTKARSIREANFVAYKIFEEKRLQTQANSLSYFEGTLGRYDPVDPTLLNKALMPDSAVPLASKHETKEISTGTITAADRIPLYISGLREMMKTYRVAVEDAVLLNPASYEFMHDRLLIKIPVNNDEGTRHEYMIGYHIMNDVREVIPNFMMTYGMFDCGIPDTKGIGICDPRAPKASYLVVEKINNAMSAARFVETAEYKEVCMLYLQVLLSLAVARERCGFAHYDLHGENVLLQPLMRTPYRQSYTVGEVKYDLGLTYLATIIDYGFAIASKTVDGRTLKLAPHNTIGVTKNYETPNIVADIYRFFMETQKRYPRPQEFQWMYDFFAPSGSRSSPIVKAVEEQKDSYYYYPYLGENVTPLINMLVQACSGSYGPDLGKVVTSNRTHDIRLPTSVFEYYERYEEFRERKLTSTYLVLILQSAIAQCHNIEQKLKATNSPYPAVRYYGVRQYLSLMKFYMFCYEKNVDILSRTREHASLGEFYRKAVGVVQQMVDEDKLFEDQRDELGNLFSDIGRGNGGKDEESQYQEFFEEKKDAEKRSLRYNSVTI